MHLLADLVEDGVVGDNEREGNEEAMQSYSDTITIDLISHGVRNKGKLSDQKTVIEFRKNARDRLAYWLANRLDQLGILTLSGVSYALTNSGAARSSGAFASLAFAADVSAPTANRHVNIVGSGAALAAGDTSTITTAATLTYKDIVNLGVYAKVNYVKPIMEGGKEYYVLLCRPEAIAQLKQDSDFINAVVQGQARSESNPFFTGAIQTVDGMIIKEHRLIFNTLDAVSGAAKWGAGSDVDGSRALLLGSQAMGFADLGAPEWFEKKFNYDSSNGINIDKMFGLVKPKYFTIYSNTVEDFGVVAVNHAI